MFAQHTCIVTYLFGRIDLFLFIIKSYQNCLQLTYWMLSTLFIHLGFVSEWCGNTIEIFIRCAPSSLLDIEYYVMSSNHTFTMKWLHVTISRYKTLNVKIFTCLKNSQGLTIVWFLIKKTVNNPGLIFVCKNINIEAWYSQSFFYCIAYG